MAAEKMPLSWAWCREFVAIFRLMINWNSTLIGLGKLRLGLIKLAPKLLVTALRKFPGIVSHGAADGFCTRKGLANSHKLQASTSRNSKRVLLHCDHIRLSSHNPTPAQLLIILLLTDLFSSVKCNIRNKITQFICTNHYRIIRCMYHVSQNYMFYTFIDM